MWISKAAMLGHLGSMHGKCPVSDHYHIAETIEGENLYKHFSNFMSDTLYES